MSIQKIANVSRQGVLPNKLIEFGDIVSITHAARLVNRNPSLIWYHCRDKKIRFPTGELASYCRDGRWYVHLPTTVDHFKRVRRRAWKGRK